MMSESGASSSAESDVAVLKRQLERYAEDFAALVADYDALRSEFDEVHRTQANEANRATAPANESASEVLISNLLVNSRNAVLVTDAKGSILGINSAFTRITGYNESEVLGHTPKLLASGRHNATFYGEFWQGLQTHGEWQGEIWNRRKSGEAYPQWLHVSASLDDAGAVRNYVGIFSDISAMKRIEERVHKLAHHDPLTGLPNRTLLNDRLGQALAAARRNNDQVGLMFLDLDRFKQVNDTLGHDVGDELLIEFGNRLLGVVRGTDTVARLGGDEFVILVARLADRDDLLVIAEKIIASLLIPAVIKGHELNIVTSIGAAIYPEHGATAEDLLKNADTAMYVAKRTEGSQFSYFSDQIDAERRRQKDLEQSLRHAIALDQLFLVYQPQYERSGQRIEAVEALVRWNLPGRGELTPDQFLPLAESSGLILPIGRWVMQTACAQQVAWCRSGLPPVRIAINLSARQLNDPGFAKQAEKIIAESGIEPRHLELEVTEAHLMSGKGCALEHIDRLHRLGVRIAIDDFGSGYTSLTRLQSLPVDAIKLDPSFIANLDRDEAGRQVAIAILGMAQSMGLATVAEGVETEAQWHTLADHLCDQLQGFQFSAPQKLAGITDLLSQNENILDGVLE